mgnify:CR=1 FL=1
MDDNNLIKENLIIDSDMASFSTDVIEASKEVPIIVDFWAEWCAPCKQLGPILESTTKAYNGKIRLVKIDADKNENLMQQLKIQSLPTVFAFFNGQPVDGFSGAMPENEVKNFIKKIISSSGGDKEEQINIMIKEAESKFAKEEFEEALQKFSILLSEDATNSKIIAGYGKCLLKLNREQELDELIDGLEESILTEAPIESLLAFKKLTQNSKNAGKPEDFSELVKNDPKNNSARFKLSEALLAKDKKEEAIFHLLEIVKNDRTWENDKARKKIIELLNALGEEDPITAPTRLKLSSILFA